MSALVREAMGRGRAVLGDHDRSGWAVLAAVASHTNRAGVADPGPSQRALAALVPYGRSAVGLALARLEAAGLIDYRRGAGPGHGPRYALMWVEPEPEPAAVVPITRHHRYPQVATDARHVHHRRVIPK